MGSSRRRRTRSARAADDPRRRRIRRAIVLSLLLTGSALAALLALSQSGFSPRLLGLYVERRAQGHAPWIESLGQAIGSVLLRLDRGRVEPRLQYPEWIGPSSARSPRPAPGNTRQVIVFDADQALAAIANASAGDVISFAPGRYLFDGKPIAARAAGRADAPIVVRAEHFGTVQLQFNIVDGFHVSGPWWVFENLVIEGACGDHSACEHAFHVVGAAQRVQIRNNEVRDFNAHVKINGAGGRFPDGGVVEGNRLINTSARRTASPVTPVDLVAANAWTIKDNLIADFVKAQGDQTSYGAFAKGGGVGNRFTGNIVLCEHRLRGAPGRRVGLSFGGGGSDIKFCRDRRCVVEHEGGVMHSNLIASCSDVGIYINRAASTRLAHNTLLDTAGISVRFPESAAEVTANLVDGPLQERDGGAIDARDNHDTSVLMLYAGWHPVRGLFRDADAIDLAWHGTAPSREADDPAPDLCGIVRKGRAAVGAFEDIVACHKKGVSAED